MGDQEMTSYGRRAQRIFEREKTEAARQAGPSWATGGKRERGKPLSQEIEKEVERVFLGHEEGATIRLISEEAEVKWETAATWLEVFRLRGWAKAIRYGNSIVYIPIGGK